MRTSVVALLITAVLILRCAPGREKIPPVPESPSVQTKLVIYQMMTRLFGNTTANNKPFGTIEDNGVGKFNDISFAALEGIKELGVTHVWYTGIIEHATLTDYTSYGIPADDPDVVKGRAGSPYAIKDYYDVDPDLAVNVRNRMGEFEQLVDRTHKAGMKVIIDFIPNHVARSYHSDVKPDGVPDFGEHDDKDKAFAVNNNFYYLPGQAFQPPKDHSKQFSPYYSGMDGRYEEMPAKATGDDKFVANPPADSWFETVKLNYGVDYLNGRTAHFDSIPDTWVRMKDILVFWAGKHVDGFRCDMAEMVPVEFWHWVIPQVKVVNPELVFIAEIYKPGQYTNYVERGRFDFLYDKVQLYDTLRLLINGHASTLDIPRIQHALQNLNGRMLHFLENHDEQRIASTYFAGNPAKAISAMVISATIDQGPVMIYFGQEVGEPALGSEGFGSNDGRTSNFDYWGVPEFQKWVNGGAFDGGQLSEDQNALRAAYARILTLSRTSKAITQGTYHDLTAFNVASDGHSDRVISYARGSDDERLIVIGGFNRRPERVQVRLTPELMQAWSLKSDSSLELIDLLSDSVSVPWNAQEGLTLQLPPYGVHVFKMR